MKDIRIAVRLDKETHEQIKKIAPEGNVSMWVRQIIKKEMEKEPSK